MWQPAGAACVVVILLAACGSDSTGVGGDAPTLTVVSGAEQTAQVATRLPDPVVVRAMRGSQATGAVEISFVVTAGGGSVDSALVVTDSGGYARTGWTLGTMAGVQSLVVRSTTDSGAKTPADTITAIATAAEAAAMTQFAGNNQFAFSGFPVAVAPAVLVSDTYGNPKSDVPVTFTVASGGGSLSGAGGDSAQSTIEMTAADGTAEPASWTVGIVPGSNTLSASSGTLNGSPATFASTGLFSISAIGTGRYHSCELSSDGAVFCAGDNLHGQLANGSMTSALRMRPGAPGRRFVHIATGSLTTCALTTDGDAYCWGQGTSGELGNGLTQDASLPVAVSGGLKFRSIAVGFAHACGVTVDSVGYCWGYNQDGELGDNTTTNRSTPVIAGGAPMFNPPLRFAQIAAGDGASCGLTASGVGYCWGRALLSAFASPGQNQLTPHAIPGRYVWRQLSVSSRHACGVITGFAVFCWGNNASGKLGDGTTTNRLTPTAVFLGGLAVQQVVANEESTCGLSTAGKAFCWGNDDFGSLGDGTMTSSPVTVPVATGQTFSALGDAHDGSQCAVSRLGGPPWCWGFNRNGQLGTGSTADAVTRPVPVPNPSRFP
jgi:alpha-tubulin suppressor-like RCC1 family protein